MGPYARVPKCPGTADRSEHDASRHADHRQRSSSPRRLSRAQEAGFCLQSNAGPTDVSHPDARGREVADGWTIAGAPYSSPLALQLGDVDIHAALLGDGLDRAREIGIAQQFLVTHSANGCRGGCDTLKISATAFSA